MKESLAEAWERFERLHKSADSLRGVPTGFKELDNILSGLQKSDLIILAARPSMGKTTLALDIARQAAMNQGTPTVIFSLEMSTQQLVDRLLGAESKVNAWNLRTGNLSAEAEFTKIRDSLDRLSKAPIFVDDMAGNSIVRMRSVCRRIRAEHGIGLIIVDYLQLMSTSKNFDSMVNQVTEISRSEDKYKEESEQTNITEILIEKHRNGPVGKIDLYFDKKSATFMTIEKTNVNQFVSAFADKGDLEQF